MTRTQIIASAFTAAIVFGSFVGFAAQVDRAPTFTDPEECADVINDLVFKYFYDHRDQASFNLEAAERAANDLTSYYCS